MKLSCLPVSYFPDLISGKRTIDSWVREAAELGFDGFDLSILFFRKSPEDTATQCRKAAEKHRISPAIINTYSDLTHPEKTRRKEETALLLQDIRTAAAAGAEFVRIVAGQGYPETSRKEGIRQVTEGFLQAQAVAETVGIQLVYENHSKPGNWKFCDFSAAPEIFLEIADSIDGSGIHILFDTANFIVFGINPEPVLQKIVNRVKCVHAADTKVHGALVPSVIGEGIVPIPRLLRILRNGGFDSWISLEEASGTGIEGVRKGWGYILKTWESCQKI